VVTVLQQSIISKKENIECRNVMKTFKQCANLKSYLSGYGIAATYLNKMIQILDANKVIKLEIKRKTPPIQDINQEIKNLEKKIQLGKLVGLYKTHLNKLIKFKKQHPHTNKLSYMVNIKHTQSNQTIYITQLKRYIINNFMRHIKDKEELDNTELIIIELHQDVIMEEIDQNYIISEYSNDQKFKLFGILTTKLPIKHATCYFECNNEWYYYDGMRGVTKIGAFGNLLDEQLLQRKGIKFLPTKTATAFLYKRI
jgi:hypothetical protein